MKRAIPFILSTISTFFVSASFCTPPAGAETSDLQSWTQVIATVNLDEQKKWFAYMEAQPRVGDDISRLERLLIRPALGYNINPDVALFVGYAWTPTFTNSSYDEDFRNENRIWQQIIIKDQRWGLDWQHRIRQEQRIIEDVAGPSNRTRYLVRGSYPLTDSGDTGLTGYNEIFITLNSQHNGPKGGFDRDRFFVGPYFKEGIARYEVGYVGEYAHKFNADGGRMINAIMLMASFTL
jgi:hypothetical protein